MDSFKLRKGTYTIEAIASIYIEASCSYIASMVLDFEYLDNEPIEQFVDNCRKSFVEAFKEIEKQSIEVHPSFNLWFNSISRCHVCYGNAFHEQYYIKNENKHRLDGPAVISTFKDGSETWHWFIEGNILSPEKENVLNAWYRKRNERI